MLSSSIVNAKIREHMVLNTSRLPDYKSVREEVVKIVQAQKRWTTIDGEPTAEPMEVDALGKGQISQQSAGQRILQSHDGHRSQIAGGIVEGEQKHFFDQCQWRAGRRGN